MDWNIQVLGNYEYMVAVLNAAAMFGGTGNARYLLLASLGSVIGLLIMAFKAVISGGKEIELHLPLVSVFFTMLMFGSQASVVVEEVVPSGPSGIPRVRVVDNVPIGLAVLGHGISNLGVLFAQRMDQAFSSPGDNNGIPLTEGGFGRNIELLRLPLLLSDARNSNPEFGRLRENVSAYFAMCSLPKITHEGSGVQLWREKNILRMLEPGPAFAVELVDASGQRRYHGCSEAHTILGFSLGEGDSEFRRGLNKGLGGRFASGDEDAIDAINSGLDSLGVSDRSRLSGERLAAAALMVGAIDSGMVDGLRQNTGAMQQLMLQQAGRQRSVQWAAEESMFLKIIRPMISFFEAITYALAPFMALLLGFGRFGITLATKYLILPIWVVLWMPLLSICNLYTNRMLADVMFQLRDEMAGGASLSNIQWLFEEVVKVAGTAGLLTAGVPSLAMMLLFGGAVTASAYAGRLQGGDHVNEKMMAGDSATPGAALKIDDTRTQSAMSAQGLTGAATMSYSTSGLMSASESSTRTQAEQAQRTLGRSLMAAYTQSEGTELSANSGLQGAVATAMEKSRAESDELLQTLGTSRQEMLSAGMTDQQIDTFSMKMAAGLNGAGVGTAVGAAGAAAGADKLATSSNKLARVAGQALQHVFNGGPGPARAGKGGVGQAQMPVKAGVIGGVLGETIRSLSGGVSEQSASSQTSQVQLSESSTLNEGRVQQAAERYSETLSHRVGQTATSGSAESAKLAESLANSETLRDDFTAARSMTAAHAQVEQQSRQTGAEQRIPEATAIKQMLAGLADRGQSIGAMYSDAAAVLHPGVLAQHERQAELAGFDGEERMAAAVQRALLQPGAESAMAQGPQAASQFEALRGSVAEMSLGTSSFGTGVSADRYANGSTETTASYETLRSETRAIAANAGDVRTHGAAVTQEAGDRVNAAAEDAARLGGNLDPGDINRVNATPVTANPAAPTLGGQTPGQLLDADRSPQDLGKLYDKDNAPAAPVHPTEGEEKVSPQNPRWGRMTPEEADRYMGKVRSETFTEITDLVTPMGAIKDVATNVAEGDVEGLVIDAALSRIPGAGKAAKLL